MATSRTKKKQARRRARRIRFLDDVAEDAFHRAYHSHIEDISYDRLKDPEYAEWLARWAEGFFSALARDFRAERLAHERRRRAAAARTRQTARSPRKR